jgi:hypothetical protein
MKIVLAKHTTGSVCIPKYEETIPSVEPSTTESRQLTQDSLDWTEEGGVAKLTVR